MGKVFVEDFNVKCPFYHGDKDVQIKCEGIISATAINRFRSRAEVLEYKADFCSSCYQGCPMYQALQDKEEYAVQEVSTNHHERKA